MKSKILFKIELDYDRTVYAPLIELATKQYWDKNEKKYIWEFNLNDLTKVIAVLGRPIEFEYEDVELIKQYCPALKEGLKRDRYKGLSGREVIEFPKIFQIKEWRKDPDTGKPKEIVHNVPKETVVGVWEVIRKQPLNKWVKSATVAENIMNHFGITRFNREISGSFDFAKLVGERKDIYHFFYNPIYILIYLGVVEYHKRGMVMRIKDNLDLQYQFIMNSSA